MEKIKSLLRSAGEFINGNKTLIGSAIVAYVVPLIAPEAVIPLGILGKVLIIKSVPLATVVTWIGNSIATLGAGHKIVKACSKEPEVVS